MGMGLRGYVLAALLVWILVTALYEKWERARHTRSLQKRCSEISSIGTGSILVLVRVYGDAEAGWTLRALFERAYCPYRVYVGIVEDEESDTVGELEKVITHRPLMDHVHTVRYDFVARWERVGWEALHRGETHVLCMYSDTIVSSNWDSSLLRAADAAPPTSAWSAVPLHTPYRYPHLHCGRAAGVCQGQEDRAVDHNDMSPQHHRAPPAHFPCLEAAEMPWLGPRVRLQPCALARPAPTLLWTSRFGFCAAELFQRALGYLPENRTSDSLDDCFMTAALIRAGAHLVLPERSLSSNLSPHRSMKSQSFTPSGAHRALLQYFRTYTNTDVEKLFVGQRARLGLSPSPSMEEIMIKYGSYAKYQQAHARLVKEKKLLNQDK